MNENNDIEVTNQNKKENVIEEENDENNFEKELNKIEVNDQLVNEILQDKERHVDILSYPAEYDKAVNHLKACQFYDPSKQNTNEAGKHI